MPRWLVALFWRSSQTSRREQGATSTGGVAQTSWSFRCPCGSRRESTPVLETVMVDLVNPELAIPELMADAVTDAMILSDCCYRKGTTPNTF